MIFISDYGGFLAYSFPSRPAHTPLVDCVAMLRAEYDLQYYPAEVIGMQVLNEKRRARALCRKPVCIQKKFNLIK